MFDQVDKQLEDWIKSVQDEIEVTLVLPTMAVPKACVCLYLLDVAPYLTGRSNDLFALQIMLRYLIVPFAEELQKAHQVLGNLLVAALQNKEFEVEKEPLLLAAWTAFGIAPRPSFVLRVPFKVERSAKPAPKVRQKLVLQTLPRQTLSGEILGTGDLPIVNARIEIPELNRSVLTDYQGCFQFSTVLSEPSVKKLLVTTKGRVFSVDIDQTEKADEKLIIHLNLEE